MCSQCSLGRGLVTQVVQPPEDPFRDQDSPLAIGENPPRSDIDGTVPFDDAIDGKGRGLNILPKYVGKVSVLYQRPAA